MASTRRVTPIALALLAALAASAQVVETDGAIRVSAGALTLSLARATGQPSAGGLAITEGPQAAPVALGEAQDWRLRPDGLSYRRDEAAGGLAVAVAMRTAGTDAILVELALSNAGTRPRLLEVRWSAAVAGAGLTAWDGRDGRPATFPEYRGGDLSLRLPLSVAYHAGGGVAVGLDPSRPLSTFRNRFEPTADGGLAGFSTRLVVDPGAAVALPLCAFAFTPTFGHLDAVQRWYGLYPGCFTIHPEVRPSLIGGGGYLQSQQTTRELQWEEARRFGMTWEWAYCPAQTPGDWYADERFYDPEKGYAGPTDAHRNGPKGSLDDYRRDMRERFHRGWWATNLAYYMLPHAADETVLAAFPDGVVLDAKGQRHPKIVGWIKPDATTRMTYPWGNAYGQEVVREIEQITGDFGPAAIGFDEAYGGLRHYGPGIAGDPARAWDDEGKIYASTQVALAHLGDVIHRQRVRGYAVACVFNKPTSINTAVRCDIGMHEHPPYENVDAIGPLRLLLGHKPMSWWSPLKTWEVLDWQRLDAAQIRAGMQGMYAYVRLASLRYGAFPMGHQVRGVRSMVALMPVLSELLREGWQPTPAATAHADLWLSRYGAGVGTYLVAGNPKRSQRPGELRVIESYLEGQTLFAGYHGNPLTVRSENGVSTLDLGTLDGHGHRIARALVQVVSDTPAALRGSAAMDWQPLARGTVRGSWQAARDRVGTLRVRLPPGARPIEVRLNGTVIEAAVEANRLHWRGSIPAQGEVVVTYAPQVMVESPLEALRAFPLRRDDGSPARVVTAPGGGDGDAHLAAFLRAYVDYWQRRQVDPVSAVAGLAAVEAEAVLPIVSEEPAEGPRLVFRQEDRPRLRLEGERLAIGGATWEQREAALRRLLGIRDAAHPFVGALNDHPMHVKAGLAGEALD